MRILHRNKMMVGKYWIFCYWWWNDEACLKKKKNVSPFHALLPPLWTERRVWMNGRHWSFTPYVMCYKIGVNERAWPTFVVVSVTVGIVAFSINAFVLFVAQVNAGTKLKWHFSDFCFPSYSWISQTRRNVPWDHWHVLPLGTLHTFKPQSLEVVKMCNRKIRTYRWIFSVGLY